MKFEIEGREYKIEKVTITGVINRELIIYYIVKNESYHSMIPTVKYSELSFMLNNDLSASDNLKIGKELTIVLDKYGEKLLVITPYNTVLIPNKKYLKSQNIDKEELINKTKEILNGKTLTLK